MPLDDSILIRISKEMKDRMKKLNGVSWSSWIRAQIWRKIEQEEKARKATGLLRNFCYSCGKPLITANDEYCGHCGASQIQPIKKE